jgi:hypothetical protein
LFKVFIRICCAKSKIKGGEREYSATSKLVYMGCNVQIGETINISGMLWLQLSSIFIAGKGGSFLPLPEYYLPPWLSGEDHSLFIKVCGKNCVLS